MTTEPPGYLIAAWSALEACTPENGPLVYYPGSHRLPFVSTHDYDSGNGTFTLGKDSNARYEEKIASLIKEKKLEAKTFLANPGDVLIWHSNLLHAGSPILGKASPGKEITLDLTQRIQIKGYCINIGKWNLFRINFYSGNFTLILSNSQNRMAFFDKHCYSFESISIGFCCSSKNQRFFVFHDFISWRQR
jgi:hypothetical protein